MVEDLLFIKRISFHFFKGWFMVAISQRSNRIVLIKNWCIITTPYDPKGTISFQGNFYGHSTIADGEIAITSRIIHYYSDRDLFASLNTLYRLCKVDSEYEKKFPNARKRLLASLRYGVQSPS